MRLPINDVVVGGKLILDDYFYVKLTNIYNKPN